LLKDAGLGRKWFTGTSAPSHPSENGSPEPPDGFPAAENGSPEPPAAWHLCNLNLLLCTEICVVLCFLLLLCFGCGFIDCYSLEYVQFLFYLFVHFVCFYCYIVGFACVLVVLLLCKYVGLWQLESVAMCLIRENL
jgi:hypothetical protein